MNVDEIIKNIQLGVVAIEEHLDVFTEQEKEDYHYMINNIEVLVNLLKGCINLKTENKILEETKTENLRKLLQVEKRHTDLLNESLQKAGEEFEKAKIDYVEDRIDLAKLNIYQGYYKALEDLKRRVLNK